MKNEKKIKASNGFVADKRKDILFYVALGAIPIFMFIFKNVILNLSAFAYSFQRYEGRRLVFAGLNNFKQVLYDLKNETWFSNALSNSLRLYFYMLVFTTIVPILVSFFLFKKFPMSGFFKVVMFIPNILSSVVTATAYKFICDRVIPTLALEWFNVDLGLGLISENSTRFGALMFNRLWFTLGAGMLMNIALMNSTDKNTIEAGTIDGCTLLQEFWHIVLPHCYPTLILGFVFGFSSIFTDDFGLYAYFGEVAPKDLWTIGYVYTIKTINANEYVYPYYSAWGMLQSMIVIPLTFAARYFTLRYGPSED